MKKNNLLFILIILLLAFNSIFLFSCKKNVDLTDYISELKSNVYFAENNDCKLKATYGFSEEPKTLDGKIDKKKYFLTFTFLCETDSNISYKIVFNVNNVAYQGNFILSKENFNHEATFEIKKVPDEFEATLTVADKNIPLTFTSAKTKECKDYKTALNSLLISQPELLSKYFYNEEFKGEIALRLIIENNKEYYYVGLTDINEKTTAFLIDAISLEVLAIKNIF